MTPLKKGALTVAMLLVGAVPALTLLVDPFSPPRDEGTNPAAPKSLGSPVPLAPEPPAQGEDQGDESRDDRSSGRDNEGDEHDEDDRGWKKRDSGREDEHSKGGSKVSIRIGSQD